MSLLVVRNRRLWIETFPVFLLLLKSFVTVVLKMTAERPESIQRRESEMGMNSRYCTASCVINSASSSRGAIFFMKNEERERGQSVLNGSNIASMMTRRKSANTLELSFTSLSNTSRSRLSSTCPLYPTPLPSCCPGTLPSFSTLPARTRRQF